MDRRQSGALVQHLRQLVDPQADRDLSDAALLGRFAGGQDESAFAALVHRHGRLVWDVCRHVLRDDHDAEDAFQGTFLVLARKAGSIRKQQSVASWLHGVAYRVAQKARVAAARRRIHETRAASLPPAKPGCEMAWRELQAILDDELNRLPEKFKAPFVLCCLQGKSKKEAAEELGWKEGTVSSRLAQARTRLQQRLSRRGVTLSALLCGTVLAQNSASAMLPPLLAAGTVKAAATFVLGAGVEAGQAVALAEAVLQAMAATRYKLAVVFLALLVAAGAAWALRPVKEDRKTLDSPQAQRDVPLPAPGPEIQARPDAEGQMTVTGRISTRDRQPLAGATVAVTAAARREIGAPALDIPSGSTILCSGQTDTQGRFHLVLERPNPERHNVIGLLAVAPGYAPSWAPVSHRDSFHEAQVVACELDPSQVVRGRLVDASGKPAGGVRVQVVTMMKRSGLHQGVRFRVPRQELPVWSVSATTDETGRFLLGNVGSNCDVALQVRDPRFAPQWLHLKTGPAEQKSETAFSVQPRRILEGRVLAGDTGQPLAHARLFSVSQGPGADARMGMAETRTDAQGRFQLSPFPGEQLSVSAYPAGGEPYLFLQKALKWPAGQTRHVIDFLLPRGVIVTGQVVEESTNQPVAGAQVEYQARPGGSLVSVKAKDGSFNNACGWDDTQTGPDGTFRLAILPGTGTLLVKGPGAEYIHVEVSSGELAGDKPAGRPFFPDAFLFLEPRRDTPGRKHVVRLRRGVTLTGRVLGQNGQPVPAGFLVASTYLPMGNWFALRGDHLPVRQGRFDLPGCDPEKTVPIVFYDVKTVQGAFAELSPRRAATEPVQVRLAPCGSASVRLVDQTGQPISLSAVMFDLVLRKGPTIQESFDMGGPAAITIPAGRFFGPQSVRFDPRTGNMTFSQLIPGATYLLQVHEGRGFVRKATFHVEPGEKRALPDIVLNRTR